MTESADASTGFVGLTGDLTAGRLLREARQAQGLHIAALATSIKVAPKKLELLESDRVDELPDAAFTRALAQTVCRALKIDPAPVLKLLPSVSDRRLESVGEGLNTPFRDRPGQIVPNDWSMLRSPAVWGPLLVILFALAIWLAPAGLLERSASGIGAARESAGAAPAPTLFNASNGSATPPLTDAPGGGGSLPVAAPSVLSAGVSASATEAADTPPSTPAPISIPGPASASTALATASLLQLRTTAASWVEVTDARGRSLLARLLQPGEAIAVDGATPLKVRIGNASGTELSFRGQPLSLASHTRDNVARLDLK